MITGNQLHMTTITWMISTDMSRKLILFSSGALLLGLVFSLSMVMGSQADGDIRVETAYTFGPIEPEEVAKLATTVVKGTIIDQKQVIEYKDKETQDGEILKNHYAIPSQMYTIQTSHVIKGEDTPKTFDVQMRGVGIVDGLRWDAGYQDYSKGDQLVLILEKTDRHEYYRPVSAYFGVYEIEDNNAIGSEREFTEQELLQKLQ